MPVIYAEEGLKEKVRKKAQEYDKYLREGGDKLPANQRSALKYVIDQMYAMANSPRRLKASAQKEFRLLRESATNLCALPTSGEPCRYSAGLLSGGRVGAHFGAS